MIDKERLVLWCGLQGKLAADARRDWYSSLGRSPHKQMRGVTLAIKLDKHRNSFQLAHRPPPLSVTDSSICPFRKDDCKPARPFLHLDEKTERGHEELAFKVRDASSNRSLDIGAVSSANCKRKRDTKKQPLPSDPDSIPGGRIFATSI